MSFLHSYVPNPILIDFGFISIHWYGLLLTLGAVAGFLVARRLFRKYGIHLDHLYNLGFYLVIFGLLGARLGHVVAETSYYLNHPSEIIAIWNGGLAIHGAIFAGIVVIWVYLKKNKVLCDSLLKFNYPQVNTKNEYRNPKQIQNSNEQSFKNLRFGDWDLFKNRKLKIKNFPRPSCFLHLVDIFAPALILGQAIGRWGNYFNQELFGLPTSLPWGIPIELANRISGFEQYVFFHPTFLYESFANLIVFALLVWLHKLNITCHPRAGGDPELEKNKPRFPIPEKLRHGAGKSGMTIVRPGSIFAVYLIGYSIIRIVVGLVRIDPVPLLNGIRLPVLVSGLLIIAGIFVLLYSQNIWKRKT